MSTIINKLPHNWADEDILNWAKGDVIVGDNLTEEDLAKEACVRLKSGYVSIEFTKEALLATVVDEVESTVTVSESEEPVAETPIAEEPAVEPVVEPAVEPPVHTPSPTVNDTKDDQVMSTLELGLSDYIETMTPGRSHSGNVGPITQIKLYRLLQMVLRQEGSVFSKLYGKVLSEVAANRKGVFNERYLFRYFDNLNLPINDRKNFERLLNLIITTCEPATRSNTIKQVDLDMTLAGFKDGNIQQRVNAFYLGM